MLLDDVENCLHISKEVFGDDYHHPIHFELSNKNHHYFIAEKNNQIIGFSIHYKVSDKEMEKITSDHFPLTYPNYYLIDVVAIAKKHQKKGAGTLLIDKILNTRDPSVPLYSIAWKDITGINIEKLYHNYNIKPRVNLGKVWAHGCNHKFVCTSYIHKCQCEGWLFQLVPC